jgi:hypothetical protein
VQPQASFTMSAATMLLLGRFQKVCTFANALLYIFL